MIPKGNFNFPQDFPVDLVDCGSDNFCGFRCEILKERLKILLVDVVPRLQLTPFHHCVCRADGHRLQEPPFPCIDIVLLAVNFCKDAVDFPRMSV